MWTGQTARERVKEREERRRERKGGDLQNNLDKKKRKERERRMRERRMMERKKEEGLFSRGPLNVSYKSL